MVAVVILASISTNRSLYSGITTAMFVLVAVDVFVVKIMRNRMDKMVVMPKVASTYPFCAMSVAGNPVPWKLTRVLA